MKHEVVNMSFPSVVNEIRRLSQDEGLRDDEIAKLIGCSRATVNRERSKHNIPTANLANRKDKICTCRVCGREFVIRRKERKPGICTECKQKAKGA
jgi:transcriptional regulator with XRE-family HTH domain